MNPATLAVDVGTAQDNGTGLQTTDLTIDKLTQTVFGGWILTDGSPVINTANLPISQPLLDPLGALIPTINASSSISDVPTTADVLPGASVLSISGIGTSLSDNGAFALLKGQSTATSDTETQVAAQLPPASEADVAQSVVADAGLNNMAASAADMGIIAPTPESEEAETVITSPILLEQLEKATPHYQLSEDQPPEGIEKVTLSLFTAPNLGPDFGMPELIELHAELQAIYDNIQIHSEWRPAYWIEPLEGTGNYRVHLNDNGMPIRTWAIDWGDFSPIQTVENVSYVDHHFFGAGGDSILVSANGVCYTYQGYAPGVIGSIADQDGGKKLNRVTDMKGEDIVMPEKPPVLAVVGDQSADTNIMLDLSELGSFSHYATEGDFTFRIDWGDGTAPDTGIATIVSEGYADILSVGNFGGRHVYTDGGVYYIAATIIDPAGESDTQTVRVLVNQSVVSDTSNPGGSQLQNPDSALQDSPITDNGQTETISDTPISQGSEGMESFVSGMDTSGSDPALLAAVRRALGLSADAIVWSDDWARLTTLSADSNKVMSLSGLEYAVNLQSLSLVPSDFSDPGHLTSLLQLTGLTNIRYLTLQRCGVTDSMLSALPNLSNLESLDLRYNNITAIPTAFPTASYLSKVSSLYVYGNPLADNPRVGLAALAGKLVNVDLAPDHPERALTLINTFDVSFNADDVYEELAGAFYDLPMEIYEYVLNNIKFEPYQGAMKGSLGVLQTGKGNDWDTDSLLVELFEKAGVTGMTYATTEVYRAVQPTMDYLGVLTRNALYNVLSEAALIPTFRDANRNALPVSQAANAVYVSFHHTWLEVNMTVPGQTQAQTIVLDPSWKYRDYQSGIQGMLSSEPFEETTYLAATSKETAAEYYETQVRDYLAGSQPDKTIADVVYDGPIRAQVITSFSTGIPYDYFTTPVGRTTSIPTEYQHQLRISVAVPQTGNKVRGEQYNGTTTKITANSGVFNATMQGKPLVIETSSGSKAFIVDSCSSSTIVYVKGDATGTNMDFSIPGFTYQDETADLGLKRATLFCTGSGPYTPTLQINGSPAAASAYTLTSGATYCIIVEYLPGNPGLSGREYSDVYKRTVGEYLALGIDAGQTAPQMLSNARKIVNGEEITKVNSGTPDRDRLIGGFLELAGLTYYQQIHRGQDEICALTDSQSVHHNVETALISTSTSDTSQLDYYEKVQFPYMPHAMLIDAKGTWWKSVTINDVTANAVMRDRMIGYTRSAAEAGVWEELVNIPSISTIKAIQLAHEQGISVVTIPDDGSVSSLLGALDQKVRDAITAYVNQGYKVVVPRQNVSIGNNPSEKWIGVGYITRKLENGQWMDYGYIIHGGINGQIDDPHGGYAIAPPSPVYVAPLNFNQSYLTYVGDPINSANGEVLHDETDVNIPNLGVPLSFARHYHSFNTQQTWADRGLGAGWSYSFSDMLEGTESPNSDKTWFTDSGVRLTFAWNSSTSTYTTPSSIYGKLEYLGAGLGYRWTDKTGSTVKFSDNGKLFRMLDRYGDGVEVTYNGNNIDKVKRVLNTVVSSPEVGLQFAYNASNHIVSVSDYIGSTINRTWRYDYNSANRLTSVTAPIASGMRLAQTQYTYFPETNTALQGLLNTVVDPNGGITEYAYYANRRGMSVKNAAGDTHSLSYNLYRNRTSFIDERQFASIYTYDDNGNVREQQNPDLTATEYTWTGGLKTAEKDLFGQTSTYHYDANGNIDRYEDQNHNVTTFTYSSVNNNLLTKTRQADGMVTKYTYSDDGSTINDNGKSLWKITEDYGTGCFNYVTIYEYDWGTTTNRGLVKAKTLPLGYGYSDGRYSTKYSHNAAGQVTLERSRISDDQWATTSSVYNPDGTLQSTTTGYYTNNAGTPLGGGTTTTYTYDALGRRKSQTQADPDDFTATTGVNGPLVAPKTLNVYDAAGLLISTSLVTAFPQRTTSAAYDKMQRETKTVNADGTYRTRKYDASGNLVYDTDELGRITQYIYDSGARCTTIIRPDGTTVRTAYNGGGRAISTTDANGNTTKYTYDVLGRKKSVIQCDPGGGSNTATTQYFYDAVGNLQYVVNAQGSVTSDTAHTTRYYYDKLGRKTAEVMPDPDGSGTGNPLLSPITLYAYDANGNLASTVDARGASEDSLSSSGVPSDTSGNDAAHKTEYFYDELGRKIIEKTPDPDGTSGPLSNLYTWYYYDAGGNLKYVVNAGGATSVNRPANFSSSVNYTTEYVNDRLHRKTAEILPDPDGPEVNHPLSRPVTLYAYDDNGNLVSVTDPLLNVTTTEYDLRNRSAQTTDALGAYAGDPAHTSTTTYDPVGNVLFVTNALGAMTTYGYDVMNRKVVQMLPLPDSTWGQVAPTTIWEYDNNGNLWRTTDPRGNASYVFYDAWNRPTSTLDALGNTTSTTYDNLSRVLSVTDQLKRITTYQYDNLGRKIQLTAPDPDDYTATGGGNGSLVSSVTYYGYDAVGNLKYVTNPPTADGGSTIRGNSTYTTWYFFDMLNRQVCVVDPLGTDYGLSSIPDAKPATQENHSTVTTFNALGNVISVRSPVDAATSSFRTIDYTYDNLGRKKTTTQHDSSTSTNPTTTNNYDANGHVISTVDPLGNTTHYIFDDLGRQIRTVSALGYGPDDMRFATVTNYDAIGNITSIADSVGNTTSYAYDRLGRKVKETDPLLNERTQKFDANGNLVQTVDGIGRIIVYAYDALNRQTQEVWSNGTAIVHAIQTNYNNVGQVVGIVATDYQSGSPVNSVGGSRYQYAYDQAGRKIREKMASGDYAQYAANVDAGTFGSGAGQINNQYDWDGDGTTERYFARKLTGLVVGDIVSLQIYSPDFQPSIIIYRPGASSYTQAWTFPKGGVYQFYYPIDQAGDWIIMATAESLVTGSFNMQSLVNPFVSNAVTEFNYTYFADGGMKSVVDDWGNRIDYQYDALGRMTQEKQSGSQTSTKQADFTYYDDNQTRTIARAYGTTPTNVATSTYGYDGMGRLTSLSHVHGGTTLAAYTWQYDLASRMIYMTSPDGITDLTNTAGGFGYDATNQLKGADFSYQTDDVFAYDANGNRTQSGTGGGAKTWKTGANNRLLSDGTYTYTYDKEGNRTAKFRDNNGNGVLDMFRSLPSANFTFAFFLQTHGLCPHFGQGSRSQTHGRFPHSGHGCSGSFLHSQGCLPHFGQGSGSSGSPSHSGSLKW
jgi:YD repeat-containing protein